MSDADELRVYLAERDAPCPRCGYNLRGVTAEACPECGCPLAIGLSDPAIPRLLWWFALLCAATIAVGEGINGAMGLRNAAFNWGYPGDVGAWLVWITVSGQCAVAIVAAVLLVRLLVGQHRSGRRSLRLMLIIAGMYSFGWIVNAVFQAVQWLIAW